MREQEIRLARKEDAKAIEDVIQQWASQEWPTWRPERRRTILEVLEDKKNHLVLVVEASDEIVGVLHLIFYSDILNGCSNCHLNFLLVKEEYRGTGIGSNILDEAVKHAKKRNAKDMHVDTMFEKAARFYREHGFRDDGIWLELSLRNGSERT